MESFFYYKGYGIRYSTFGGITVVESLGFTIKEFRGLGSYKGKEEAKKFIDNLTI